MANFFDFNADFSPSEEESRLIPLMTSDDEETILKESLPESVPILPLRNAVLFPELSFQSLQQEINQSNLSNMPILKTN